MRRAMYGLVGLAVGLAYYIFTIIGMPLMENVNSSSSDFHLVNKEYGESLMGSPGGAVTTIFDYGSYQLLDNEFAQREKTGHVKYGKPNPMFYYVHNSVASEESKTNEASEPAPVDVTANVEDKIMNLNNNDNSGIGGAIGADRKVIEEIKSKVVGYNINDRKHEDVDVAIQLNNFSSNGVLPIDKKFFNISSDFGERKDPLNGEKAIHTGLDISNVGIAGSNVYSAVPGIVEYAEEGSTGYGNHVIINHGTYKTVYAHLESFSVNKGDIVDAGDTIGKVGSTGRSTGPHLHFEVRIGDVTVDPTLFIERLEWAE